MAETAFGGVLAKLDSTEDRAILRIHPHVFSAEPDGKPVLEISIAEPRFLPARILVVGDEIDGWWSSNRISIFDPQQNTYVEISAQQITTCWVDYELSDFREHANALVAALDRVEARSQAADAKITTGIGLIDELIRRAELKAASSEQRRRDQASAIAALQRIRQHFLD